MSDGGYEALPYVWGNPVPACHLRDAESDSVLSITKNLYLALQALRYPDRSRILCVDAVCINQSDNDEKSHQVKNMDSVYTNTSMVIMWLDNGKFHEAVQHLHWLEESSEIDFSMAYPEPADFVDSIVATIIVIVSSEWFTRLWVIQEFILAANVQIRAGHQHINYKTLENAINKLYSRIVKWKPNPALISAESSGKGGMSLDSYRSAVVLMGFRTRWHRQPGSDLPQLSLYDCCCMTHDHPPNCANKRDLIYGLLGLAR
jgi:hypothetical protein